MEKTMSIVIDQDMLDKYELYKKLKKEMNQIYQYKFARALYNTTQWHESTDKLYDIIYKQQEHMIERPKLMKKV
jgi:hypothetical protein